MKLQVSDTSGKKLGEFELKEGLLEFDKGQQVLHQAVVAYQANRRAGTASTRTRAEVAGSGAKPWKQKGLGRARAGDRQSPIWRGGGTVFGPKPRSYAKSQNKKASRLAFRRAFSEKVASGAVQVIDELKFDAPKTSQFAAVVKALGIEKSAIFVLDQVDFNTALSARNLPNIELTSADRLNAFELLRFGRIVITRAAMEKLEARLAPRSNTKS